MVRARGTYEKKEMVSPRYSETYTYEHTVVMTACASFVQAPPRLNLNMEIGGGYEVSPLAKWLLEIDGYWGRQSVFKGFHLQVNYSPIEYHTFMNIWAAQNGLYGFKQTNNKRPQIWVWKGLDPGEVGAGVNMTKTYCTKLSSN